MVTWDVVRHRAALAGRVTETPGGKPVAGARVEITAAPPGFTARLALQAKAVDAGGAGGIRWAALAERPDRTRTAVDGHYHFLDLPAGTYTLTASLPGQGSRYGTASAQVTLTAVAGDPQGTAGLATLNLALPATTVRGKVVDGGDNAVPMAELRLRGSTESTYSNGQGQYALSRLEAGSRELVISARGFERQTKTVVLGQAGADVEVEVTLQPSTP